MPPDYSSIILVFSPAFAEVTMGTPGAISRCEVVIEDALTIGISYSGFVISNS